MSQTWNIPIPGTELLATSRGNLNSAFDALATKFSGTSAPGSPITGQWWLDTNLSPASVLKIYDGTTWRTILSAININGGGVILRDGSVAFTGDVDFGSQKGVNVASGTASTDLLNKGQVDSRVLLAMVPIRTDPVSASADFYLFSHANAVTIGDVALIVSTTTVSTGANRWTINVRNLTAANDLRSADYDTNVDGELTADARVALGLNQNQAVGAGNVLELQLVKVGAATNLDRLAAAITWTIAT